MNTRKRERRKRWAPPRLMAEHRRHRMSKRSSRRFQRRLDQLQRLRGLKEDPRYWQAFDRAARAAFKATGATSLSFDDMAPYFRAEDAGLRLLVDVPPAQGHERNRQLRRRS